MDPLTDDMARALARLADVLDVPPSPTAGRALAAAHGWDAAARAHVELYRRHRDTHGA